MKPVVLIILDGWGIASNPEADAQQRANIPFYRSLINRYPHTALECAGEAVGLPAGAMGNSEVGHLNLGAGRIVYQDYAKINKAISDGTFSENTALLHAMDESASGSKALHLAGLLSDGGVHSHISHLYALIDMAQDRGVDKIYIHAFMDGRDTPPSSGINYIRDLETFLKSRPCARIASVTGRYWAMDRDNRWDRVEKAYRALVDGDGQRYTSAEQAVQESYSKGKTDEFISPALISNNGTPVGLINDGDSVIFFNFRADRAREITSALALEEFSGFRRQNPPKIKSYVTMTQYEEDFPFETAFPPGKMENILGEVISMQGLRQLRIAETEKYAHVTYFFNGGEEDPFQGEDRCLIPSPKDVATYDLKPAMSAFSVRDEVLKRLDKGIYGFVLINFANPDMVGHTGFMDAAVKACETVDACLEAIVPRVQSMEGTVMITADHGNCDQMINDNGPHTAHTTNPVPFLLIKEGEHLRQEGILADVAPTVLDIMGINKPGEMTGTSLIAGHN